MALFPQIQVCDPISCESLQVFPLMTEPKPVDYQLSDEAIESESVTVKELTEGGSVPDLLVENEGEIRVLFIEGEELVGAKQNRILNTSVLVAAKTKTPIPVSCVEQGRWGYKSHKFGSGGRHSPHKMRYALKKSVTESTRQCRGHSSDQGEIWKEVARQERAHGSCSSTSAMSDTYDSRQNQIDEFKDKIQYTEGASGIAIAIGGKVIALDLFDKPSTCQKVWGRLLTGFIMDALEVESDQQVETAEVEKLVSALDGANWETVETVGEGQEHRLETDEGVLASALVHEGALVHGSVVVG